MTFEARNAHLSGIRVLDFSAVYAGPICTRLMADCGADVIKVEPPNGGDMIRGPKGMSRSFSHFNAGKRSVAINLNHDDGAALARELVKDADVVVENFRPGIMKRFGLDYPSLKADHPELVYCSISGFGQTGPYVNRAAYAPIAHAASGYYKAFLSSQPDPETPPVSNIMVADMLTGAYAHGAILTALVGAARTGRGDHIDVTMMESMMNLLPLQLQNAQIDREIPPGGFHPIRASDGFLMICIVSQKNLRCLAEAIGQPGLVDDERFQMNKRVYHMDAFIEAIEAYTGELTTRECEERLNEAGVPCSIYNEISDLFSHPQLMARDTFHTHEDEYGEFVVPGAPFQFASGATPPDRPAPRLGSHTMEVLSRLVDDTRLDALLNEKVIRR